jgi:hypothetical protein
MLAAALWVLPPVWAVKLVASPVGPVWAAMQAAVSPQPELAAASQPVDLPAAMRAAACPLADLAPASRPVEPAVPRAPELAAEPTAGSSARKVPRSEVAPPPPMAVASRPSTALPHPLGKPR